MTSYDRNAGASARISRAANNVRQWAADLEAIRPFLDAGPVAQTANKAWGFAMDMLVMSLEEYAAAIIEIHAAFKPREEP